MFDLLSALYHDEPLSCQDPCCLDDPQTPEERKLSIQLRAVDKEAAEALKPSICALANRRAEQSFRTGVRLGAQLTAQLLEEFS